MDFKNFVLKAALASDDKSLVEKVRSQQFEMAGKIMGLSVQLGLSQIETAERLSIPFDYLVSLEDADLNIGIDEYNDIYSKLLEISHTASTDQNI